jgi:chromate transporter
MQFKVVENAFKGIQIAVAFLILSAGIKFIKKLKKQPFPIITVALTVAVMIALDLFALSFSSVYLILMGAFAGLMLTIIQRMQGKNNADKEENK